MSDRLRSGNRVGIPRARARYLTQARELEEKEAPGVVRSGVFLTLLLLAPGVASPQARAPVVLEYDDSEQLKLKKIDTNGDGRYDEMVHYVEDNGPPGTPDASGTYYPVPAAQCNAFIPFSDPPDVETGNWIVKDRD